jgi:hypothetical protein
LNKRGQPTGLVKREHAEVRAIRVSAIVVSRMLPFADTDPNAVTFSFLLNTKSLRNFESQSAKSAQTLRSRRNTRR